MGDSARPESFARSEVLSADEYLYYYPRGNATVKMNDNTSPYGPSPRVRKLLEGRASSIIGGLQECTYYPDQTAEKLRVKIASLNSMMPGQVMVGCGADEILDLLARVFINHGDRAIVPVPAYWMYNRFATLNGARVSTPFIGKPPSLECFDPGVGKLLFISSPNNPAGNMFSTQSIATLASTFNGIVVVDEAYAEYAGTSVAPLVNEFSNLVIVRTFSKIYGLPNFRIGYSISCAATASLMRKIKNPFNVTSVSQIVALEALSDQNFVGDIRERNAVEREYVRKGMETLGLTVYPSSANFLLSEFGSSRETVHSELQIRGIFTRKIEQPGYNGCLRITVRSRKENELFLTCLNEIMGGDS